MSVAVSEVSAATPEVAAALERLIPQLTGGHVSMPVERLAALLQQPAMTLLVARDESGQVVGTASVIIVQSVSGWVARLEDVVVDASARGQGVGAALTTAAVELARARGVSGLDLTSAPHREAANRLYQRLGFQRRTTNVYRHPLTPRD